MTAVMIFQADIDEIKQKRNTRFVVDAMYLLGDKLYRELEQRGTQRDGYIAAIEAKMRSQHSTVAPTTPIGIAEQTGR